MKKLSNLFKEYFKKYTIEIALTTIYLMVVTIYIIHLKNLNKILLEMEQQKQTPLTILSYNNGMPLWFFCGAVLLILVGGLFSWRIFGKCNETIYLLEALLLIFLIVLIIVCVIIVIGHITIPIVKMILSVVFAGFIIFAVLTN